MSIRSKFAVTTILMALSLVAPVGVRLHAQEGAAGSKGAPVVLRREEAAAILPAAVFFRGQSASVQGRNSSGLRFADGKLVLATMVDTSGYSSTVQQVYQAYLLTEVPLMVGGHRLNAGAYGFGFVAGNKMTVMDIGANEILQAVTTHDEALARPNPLQILPGPSGSFRLYLGRSYVTLSIAEK
ncbi:MAG: hypothetical protein M3O02_02295 [Acidobacteriota bacterium]|nr:hypothetical protein [Acidobacteriota bacterium]